MKQKLIGYYNYTVILTYIGMLFGFSGIVCVLNEEYSPALLCLMLAGICDMFDGAIASTKKDRTSEEKLFGIQIDSLSDFVCFGMLPAVFMCGLCGKSIPSYMISGLYLLAALIRLAYYNVEEEDRQHETQEKRKYHLGLPVTMSSLLLPLPLEACSLLNLPVKYAGPGLLTIIGVCYLLPFRMRKAYFVGKIVALLFGLLALLLLIIGWGKLG